MNRTPRSCRVFAVLMSISVAPSTAMTFEPDLVTSVSQSVSVCAVATESYVQIWCMPMELGGDLVRLFDLFSVNKFHALNDLRQVCETA